MADGETFEVVIVGGAALGSAVACHLLADPAFRGRVLVVEKDPTYARAASALSAASIRQQYSQPVNIRISLHGIAFLREVDRHLTVGSERPEIGLTEGGYLLLAGSGSAADVLRENHRSQEVEGAAIALLDQEELVRRFPWLNAEDLALGALGLSGEGWFDGWGLLTALRRKARALGAVYRHDRVVGLDHGSERVEAVRLAEAGRVGCGAVVNCAGAGGAALAGAAGLDIPVRAKRRTVFSFACREPMDRAPLLVDTTGVWFRPEGAPASDGTRTFIAGWSPPADDDPDWDDDRPDTQEPDHHLFEEVMWPALAARVPVFECIRPGRAWAGPYDVNLVDHNALVGRADGFDNLYLCNGFSGHGLQQAPAIGRGLAELIVHGRYLTLDLSALSPARLAAGRPLVERNVI